MRLPFSRRKALTGTPAVVEALAARQANLWPLLGGGSRQRITDVFAKAQSAQLSWLYKKSPAIRSVIDLIVSNVGQLELRLYEEIDEANREARPDHPAALSMRYPNPQSTSDHFVRSILKDFLIFDNAYALKFRAPNQRRTVLQRIPAAMVEVRGDQLFAATSYRIHRADGTFLDLPDPTDMIQWRGEDPDDPRMGFSRLETLRAAIAEDAALQQAIVELANSGMVSPSWVSRPLEAPAWSAEAAQRFEEDLRNRLRTSNSKPVVLEEGMELHDIGVSPKDGQTLDIRKYAVQQSALAYGVPLGMVGLDDNIKDAQSEFYADTLPPYCETFCSWVNLGLLVAEYGETEFCFEFNLDEKHMGDDRLAALTSATGRPVLTTNEGRAMVNRPPIDGGDELVTPLNVIVGENPKPSVDVMGPQDPNKPLQDGSYRPEPKQLELSTGWEKFFEHKGAALIGNKGPEAVHLPEGTKAIPSSVELTDLTPARWEPRRKSDLDRQHRYVDEVAGSLERFYARQARSLLAAKSKAYDEERWDRELTEDLETLAQSIVAREAGLYVARLAGDEFDIRQVVNYLKAMAAGAAEGINRVTRKDIDEMGAQDALARARGERADVAAASIGTRATVFARIEAAKQAPNPERRVKVWIANTDRHESLDGAAVSLNSDWGGISPGSEPFCQCSMSIQ